MPRWFVALTLAMTTAIPACGGAPGADVSEETSRATPDLAEAARHVLETHCGSCHREDSPEAKPGALAIFNLNETPWQSHMTEAQLRDLVRRVRDLHELRDGPTDDLEVFGGPPSADDVRTLEAFVAAELARRGETAAAPSILLATALLAAAGAPGVPGAPAAPAPAAAAAPLPWPPLDPYLAPAEPVCLVPALTDGLYRLAVTVDRPVCPPDVSAKGRTDALACLPAETTVAVVGGCVGLGAELFAIPRLTLKRTAPDAFERSMDDGKACNSGWRESWRRTGPKALEVTREAYTICGGSRRWTGPTVALSWREKLSAKKLADVAKLARDPRAVVAAAAVERLAALQDDPTACAAMGALLDLGDVGEMDTGVATARRVLALSRAACLVPAVERAAAHVRIADAAGRRLAALLPDPAARAAAVLRAVDAGGPSAPTGAPAVVTSLPLPPDIAATLAADLRARLGAGKTEPVRTTAAAVLSAVVEPRAFAAGILSAAGAARTCEERAHLASLTIQPVVLEETEAVSLYARLLAEHTPDPGDPFPPSCVEARLHAALSLKIRLEHVHPVSDALWATLLPYLRVAGGSALDRLRYVYGTPRGCWPESKGDPRSPSRDAALKLLGLKGC